MFEKTGSHSFEELTESLGALHRYAPVNYGGVVGKQFAYSFSPPLVPNFFKPQFR
jgi:hypothetical protein